MSTTKERFFSLRGVHPNLSMSTFSSTWEPPRFQFNYRSWIKPKPLPFLFILISTSFYWRYICGRPFTDCRGDIRYLISSSQLGHFEIDARCLTRNGQNSTEIVLRIIHCIYNTKTHQCYSNQYVIDEGCRQSNHHSFIYMTNAKHFFMPSHHEVICLRGSFIKIFGGCTRNTAGGNPSAKRPILCNASPTTETCEQLC